MAKYLTRRMNKKITRATMTEYSIKALTERTVDGKVNTIIRRSITDTNPLIKILRKYFRSKFSPFCSFSG